MSITATGYPYCLTTPLDHTPFTARVPCMLCLIGSVLCHGFYMWPVDNTSSIRMPKIILLLNALNASVFDISIQTKPFSNRTQKTVTVCSHGDHDAPQADSSWWAGKMIRSWCGRCTSDVSSHVGWGMSRGLMPWRSTLSLPLGCRATHPRTWNRTA